MKILLIDVHFEKNLIPFQKSVPSLVLRQISALTPKEHEIHLIEDGKIRSQEYEKDYDLVGISTVTPAALYAYEIADQFRKNGKTVILGGYHPSALPKEAKQHADSVVIGEAEIVWSKILEDYKNKKLRPFYMNPEPVKPENIPNPDRTNINKNIKVAPIKFSRGCPIGCEFCSISHKKYGNIHRKKPIENIMKDVQTIKEKYLFVTDPSLTIDVEFTKQIFGKLRAMDKKLYYCQGNANVLKREDELLKLASEAGCLQWHIGFESISQETLNSIGKTTNKVKDYKKTIQKINDYGMAVSGEFVFGFDSDKLDVFKKTEEEIRTWNITPGFQVLIPYPGSLLYSRLEKENRIVTKDWSKYTTRDVVFKPKQMTPQQLEEGVKELAQDFYSYSKAMKRSLKSLKLGLNVFNHVTNENFYLYNSRNI